MMSTVHCSDNECFAHKVMKGGSLNITCAADGDPMPFVRWRQVGQTLDDEGDVIIY